MKALVLAGGFDQKALIAELKSRGYYVILADYYTSPVAKEIADEHYVVSTLDIDKIYEIAYREHVDIITTVCTDQALLTVAKVSEMLALPCYISHTTALNVTNKQYMKKKFEKYSIPTAHHVVVNNCENLKQKLSDLSYPLIVKPADCNSSKGVVKIESLDSLEEAVCAATNFSRTNTAIVEEYIEGVEYTVDFWIDHGEAKLLMVSEIIKYKGTNSFTICGCKTLVHLPEEKQLHLIEIATKIAEAFSLDNTPMFMQVIDSNERIDVIEFSARMGGGTKYRMIEMYSGVPIMKTYVDMVLGDKPNIQLTKKEKYIYLDFIYCKTGIFKEINGIQELLEANIITEYYQYKAIGSSIEKAENSGDRIAGMLVSADSENELLQKLNVARNAFTVVGEKEIDITIRNKG